jgi:isoleucyl-tRNA synthetase
MREIILEELNVKEVLFSENETDLVNYECKANFRVLGKELGKDMKAGAEKIAALGVADIQKLLSGGEVLIEAAGRNITLTLDKVEIKRLEKAKLRILNDKTLTVGLDTELSPSLTREGDIRDLIRGVQNLRKESGFDVVDRIRLKVWASPVAAGDSAPDAALKDAGLKEAWDEFSELAASETLAVESFWEECPGMLPIEAGGGAGGGAGGKTWLVHVERLT